MRVKEGEREKERQREADQVYVGKSDLIGPWCILIAFLVTRRLINPIPILNARCDVHYLFAPSSHAIPSLPATRFRLVLFQNGVSRDGRPGCVLSRDIWHFALDTVGIDGGALLQYLTDINGASKNKGTSGASI